MNRVTTSQRGYGARWQRESKEYLRANPLCEFCRKRGHTTLATVVDHRTPHRLAQARASGDSQAIERAYALFWGRTNWQGLCSADHNSVKQAQEKGGHIRGCDVNGMPIDPGHRWHAPSHTGGGSDLSGPNAPDRSRSHARN